MREVCALQHLSINTEKSYIHWLVRYGSFLKDPKLKPLTTEMKIEAFLTRLAITGVSASTQNQAFNAILFFYRAVLKQELGPVDSLRAKRPATIRQCPTPTEVHQLLATVSDIYRYPTRLIVHLLYGCGLRVCEPLNLRSKDVDLLRSPQHTLHPTLRRLLPRPFRRGEGWGEGLLGVVYPTALAVLGESAHAGMNE